MIHTDIYYPEQLPWPERSGYTFRDRATFERTDMVSGRAGQRKTFEFVPSSVSVTWVFRSDAEASLFRAWFRDQVNDGSEWFNCPLKTPEGEKHYICRFETMPEGPDLIGLCTWRATAKLEMFERPIMHDGWGNKPEWIVPGRSLLDFAMTMEWPEA